MSEDKAGMQVVVGPYNLFNIAYRGGKGSVPKTLRGSYSAPRIAQEAIDTFYAVARAKAKPTKTRKKAKE